MISDKKHKRSMEYTKALERKVALQRRLITNFHRLVSKMLKDGRTKTEEVKEFIKKKKC